jgi:AcrR family transcriptional regulator
VRDRLVAAGLRVLADSPAALTVRRIAQVAGTSTMGIYTCFGGRTGILEAIYLSGFEALRAALAGGPSGLAEGPSGLAGARSGLAGAPSGGDPVDRILGLALAYRRFALGNPALYAFMFERPVPDFDPAPALRRAALGLTFDPLVDAVRDAAAAGAVRAGDPVATAYLLWTVAHGAVSLELTHAVRSPLPGWFVDSPEAGARVYLDGLRTALAGLAT